MRRRACLLLLGAAVCGPAESAPVEADPAARPAAATLRGLLLAPSDLGDEYVPVNAGVRADAAFLIAGADGEPIVAQTIEWCATTAIADDRLTEHALAVAAEPDVEEHGDRAAGNARVFAGRSPTGDEVTVLAGKGRYVVTVSVAATPDTDRDLDTLLERAVQVTQALLDRLPAA
jgi:hypothetical protein